MCFPQGCLRRKSVWVAFSSHTWFIMPCMIVYDVQYSRTWLGGFSSALHCQSYEWHRQAPRGNFVGIFYVLNRNEKCESVVRIHNRIPQWAKKKKNVWNCLARSEPRDSRGESFIQSAISHNRHAVYLHVCGEQITCRKNDFVKVPRSRWCCLSGCYMIIKWFKQFFPKIRAEALTSKLFTSKKNLHLTLCHLNGQKEKHNRFFFPLKYWFAAGRVQL